MSVIENHFRNQVWDAGDWTRVLFPSAGSADVVSQNRNPRDLIIDNQSVFLWVLLCL